MTEQEAVRIKAKHRDSLLRIPGVHGVALEQDSSGAPKLTVLAEPSADVSAVPPTIEGLPVAIERTARFRPVAP
jgi:hypothetical protein